MSDLLPVKQTASNLTEPDYQGYGGQVEDYGSQVSPVRVRRMLTFLLRYWWVPVLTTILSVAAATGYVLWAPPTFTSSARMWESEKLRLPEGAAFTEDLQNYYGTQMELLQSSRMMQLAFESLQATGTNAIPRDKDGKPLMVKVKAKQQPKSSVLLLEASSSNAEYSQAYLTSLMAVFQAYRKNIRQTVSGTTVSSIADQVQRLEGELKASQSAFAAFQRTNNLAILQEEGTVSGGYLARLKTQLSDLQLEAQLLEASALQQDSTNSSNPTPYLIDSLRGAGSASSGSIGAEHQAAFKDIELLRNRRQKLSQYLKPKHPKILRLDADIERAEQLIELYRNQTRDQLASAQQAIKMRITSVLGSIKEWESKVVESKAKIAEAEHLRQNVTRSQGLYDRLTLLLQNVDISRNISQETLLVLEQAAPAIRSYREDVVVLAMAIFAGVVAGLGIVLLIEIRNDQFTSLNEVTAKFGDSIVGQVPEMGNGKVQDATALLSTANQTHVVAESYRSLRSALLFLPVEAARPKVVLITSAIPNEGKSTIAANLAGTIALGGARVLLVDCDLRKGQLHHMLGLKPEPGMAELLAHSSPMEDVLQSNCVPNLAFIARGKACDYPGDLLVGRALDELLAQWRQQFDYVLIDSSPVFAADDVATLAPKVDGTLFVVRRRYSGARAVREALELLAQRQAKVLGLVFNRADTSARSYYYYKYAGYHDGKGRTEHGTEGPKDQGTKGPKDSGAESGEQRAGMGPEATGPRD